MGQAYMSHVEQYGDEQLRLICDDPERTSEITERELTNVIAANRSQPSQANKSPSPD